MAYARKTVEMTVRQVRRVYKHSHLPHVIAREVSRRWGERYYDSALSIAGEVLCTIARSFNPEKAPQGETGFGPYAVKWMRASVKDRVIVESGTEFTFSNITEYLSSQGRLGARGSFEDALADDDQKRHVSFRKLYSNDVLKRRVRDKARRELP